MQASPKFMQFSKDAAEGLIQLPVFTKITPANREKDFWAEWLVVAWWSDVLVVSVYVAMLE
jgi:hypothetical protein